MKKLFLFTVLLSFTCIVNGCSNDDSPDCGCNGNLSQTATNYEGDLRITVDEYGNPIAFIRQVSVAWYTVCDLNFITQMNFEQGVNIPVIFSGKYTDLCLGSGVQPTDATPRYSIKLTQLTLQ